MFIFGTSSIWILSGFSWEANVKWLTPRQFSSCTKAARPLEAFITKNDTLQVFSHFKEEVAADRVFGLCFLNCVFSLFTFTQPHLCEVLKLLSLIIMTFLFCLLK